MAGAVAAECGLNFISVKGESLKVVGKSAGGGDVQEAARMIGELAGTAVRLTACREVFRGT